MNEQPPTAVPDWSRLSALLDAALLLPVDERSGWIEALPARNADLRPALRDLLARAAVETDDFMRKPVHLRGNTDPAPPDGAAAQAGTIVGPYRLLREIGVGGMGAVWLAERADGALKRRVALKLPRLSWDAPGLAQRMARERDILSGLEHPNIARLYDAGVDAHGRPYLAMEYVEGRPLDVYCDEHALGVRDRLGLFLQVARAVAHAHARLVVHRDLKPSNLLVTMDGSVRLLDFGIAKLIEGDAGAESAHETHLTRLAGRALTPDYAAPEQIRGESITVAVDVYSLGVVLYELLAGRRPYRLEGGSPAALEAALRDDVPLASTATLDKARAQKLRGDLDTIVAKALRKLPADRYATVDAFAADVQRHLDGAAVLARPDSIVYRASRLVRKHKLLVGVAILTALALVGGAAPMAAVMIALAVGVGVALWQAGVARRQAARAAEVAKEAQRERDRAMALAQRHEASLDFIQIMLTEAAPAGEKVSLNELLERSEELALASLGNHPEHHGAILDLLASAYTSFGNLAKAEPLLRKASEILRSSTDVSLRARVECNHGLVLSESGNVEIGRGMIESWLSNPGVEPTIAALCEQYLAEIARNHNDAKGALVHALGAEARLRASGRSSVAFEASLAADVAFAYFLNGHIEEADRRYAKVMQLHRDIGRDESPQAMAILNNWGILSLGTGDIRRALACFDDVQKIAGKRAPNGVPPAYTTNNRASALFSLGRFEEALREAERTQRIADSAGGAAFALNARVLQASVHRERGDFEIAGRILQDAAPMAAELSEDSFAAVGYRYGCALLALRRGCLDEAAATIEPAVRMFDDRRMRTSPLAQALRLRAEIRWRKGDLVAATADARRALDICESLRGGKAHSSIIGHCWLLLARLALAASDPAAAQPAIGQALAHLEATLGEGHPETRAARALALGSQGHS